MAKEIKKMNLEKQMIKNLENIQLIFMLNRVKNLNLLELRIQKSQIT